MLTVDFGRLRVERGMTALDAGCGQGRHTLEFLRRGCAVVGMDLAADDLRYTRYLLTALARDREPAGSAGQGGIPPFLALRGNALQLPFGPDRFERVICSEVLEHVADPGGAVAELARVLKPGGWIAVSVPTPFTEWAFRFASDDYFNTPGGHVRIFTPRRLSALLGTAGLSVGDIQFEHAFHSLYWWARSVVGLHDERHPVTRHFKKILTYTFFSSQLTRAERALNYLFPKSMVLYAQKQPGSAPPALKRRRSPGKARRPAAAGPGRSAIPRRPRAG
ncbi:MAG: class I SAM-dependent methyltransferase [bacterium]